MTHQTTPNTPKRAALTAAWCKPLTAAALTLFGEGIFFGSGAIAGPAGYSYTAIAFRDNPAPGGGDFTSDFEVSGLNERGDIAFTADLIVPGQEGIFLGSGGRLDQVVRFGQAAPGGGTFSLSELGNIGLNDEGDLAFGFSLEPLQFFFTPAEAFVWANGGVYRYSHITHELIAVALPGSPAPGGGSFVGVSFDVSMNNQGAIAFPGVVESPSGPAIAAFLANKAGQITTVAGPATPAPGGGTFDLALAPRLNQQGDVVFTGRESTAAPGQISLYLREGASGQIVAIMKSGDPAPGGGTLFVAFTPRINSAGDVAFFGGLVPFIPFGPPAPAGIYLHTRNNLLRVAGPGDPMPGGGNVTFVAGYNFSIGLNQRGEVTFSTGLDTGEEGLYLYSGGSVHLIAKTGTIIPGIGTIFSLEMGNPIVPGLPPAPSGIPTTGAPLNDRGQTLFSCSLTDGRGVLLLATPKP